ncbi:MAG: biopolymer transporter ExbD [bacterium]|nr:biopolymer transporter ExbD [bacterium]
MMSQGGIVIRLIDVVLILLFGFISISEISSKSLVNLPKSSQTNYSLPDKENLLIIGIMPDGQYLIENENELISNFDALKFYIVTKNDENIQNKIETRVRIRSNWDTPIKHTLALANLCDFLAIPKGIDVILKSDD